MRRITAAGIAWALVLSLLPAAPANPQPRKAADPDSPSVVRRITISDRGIEIVHVDSEDSGAVRVEDRRVRRTSRGGVTIVGPEAVVVNVDESGLVRVFSDAEVRSDEVVEGDVVAVFGSVRVAGEVTGNAVAVFGSLRLEPGAIVNGDAVAVGGVLVQPPGATVRGESVSIGFLPFPTGAITLRSLLTGVLICWLVSVFLGWILSLLFPTRMLRIATTASRRTGASLALGLVSAPLVVIAIVLLLVTVIGIPIALLLPVLYMLSIWAGQLATAYVLGCRLLRRRLGEGHLLPPLAAGTLFVALFFALGAILAGPAGVTRTLALFFNLFGALLVLGLAVIGTGAVLLSRVGSRPAEIEYQPASSPPAPAGAAPGGPAEPPRPSSPDMPTA